MQGRRLLAGPDGDIVFAEIRPGDYFRGADGRWYGETPNGLLAGLANHAVTEHEDGTVTVSPSILVGHGAGGKHWHGFLERGIWREC